MKSYELFCFFAKKNPIKNSQISSCVFLVLAATILSILGEGIPVKSIDSNESI